MTASIAAAMLATWLSAGATSQSEALTRARVNAYLGTESTSATDWKQLGPPAVPFLIKVINDRDESPPRRIKAINGLAAIGSKDDTRIMMDLVRAESEPVNVRVTALRVALSRLSKAEAQTQLKAILKSSRAMRLRLIAGEQLIRMSKNSGCVAVRAQVEKEKPQNQKHYQRMLRHCPPPPPPPEPAAAPENGAEPAAPEAK